MVQRGGSHPLGAEARYVVLTRGVAIKSTGTNEHVLYGVFDETETSIIKERTPRRCWGTGLVG